MHGFIRDRLEDLLTAESSSARLSGITAKYDIEEVAKHLESCAECSSEFALIKAQSALLRTLRPSEPETEPSAGFYARVMQRIEEGTKDSIWSVFIYSPFGKRLAYASLGIAALLGTYVVSLEARDGHLGGKTVVARQFPADTPVFGSQDQQRDAVLINFATEPEPVEQGSLQ
jgi:anti-sigma factor RsiW